MTVALAADHAGYDMKQLLAAALAGDGYTIIDLGTDSREPVDYPDYALALGAAVLEGRAERGILVCGSGVGACVAANKIKGIRAGTCHDTYSGHQGVEHDDMNVLCLGARVIGTAPALEICRAFLAAQFSNEERHLRRVAKTLAIEQQRG
jgi:RpiB/LacA/LacB family sugar-phosphate isomerase